MSQDASTAPLVACPLTGPIVPGEGVDAAKEPAADCAAPVRARYDAATSSVQLDLTGLARDWVSGARVNNGIVLRPDPAAAVPTTLPFQLALLGAGSVTAQLTASAAPGPLPAPSPASPATSQPVPAVPVAPAPYAVPVVTVPAHGLPAPVVAPRPTAAPAPVAVALPALGPRVAATQAPARSSAAGFALAGALGVLLLSGFGWSVGEAADVRAYARAERRRLDRLRWVAPVPQRRQIRQGRRPFVSATSTVTYS